MVQSVARVTLAGVAILSALTLPALAYPAEFDGSVLETREFSEETLPYVRRHFTKRELDEFELDARELADDSFELEAREPEPLHVPFFSNWNAGRKQRNQDRQRGKAMRKEGEALGERDLNDMEFDLEAREAEHELDARELGDDSFELEAREPEPEHELDAREFADDSFELEAREPEPIHIPFFSNWNAGRKQRNQDRQRGKEMRKEGEALAERDLNDMEDLEAREPEPEPLHIPFFSDWNAGRKQRNNDLHRGEAIRKTEERVGASLSVRELPEELEAREFFDLEIDELD